MTSNEMQLFYGILVLMSMVKSQQDCMADLVRSVEAINTSTAALIKCAAAADVRLSVLESLNGH